MSRREKILENFPEISGKCPSEKFFRNSGEFPSKKDNFTAVNTYTQHCIPIENLPEILRKIPQNPGNSPGKISRNQEICTLCKTRFHGCNYLFFDAFSEGNFREISGKIFPAEKNSGKSRNFREGRPLENTNFNTC